MVPELTLVVHQLEGIHSYIRMEVVRQDDTSPL